MTTLYLRRPPSPQEVVARAEKRLVGLIARKGRIDDPEVVAVFRRYQQHELIARGLVPSVLDAEIERALRGVA